MDEIQKKKEKGSSFARGPNKKQIRNFKSKNKNVGMKKTITFQGLFSPTQSKRSPKDLKSVLFLHQLGGPCQPSLQVFNVSLPSNVIHNFSLSLSLFCSFLLIHFSFLKQKVGNSTHPAVGHKTRNRHTTQTHFDNHFKQSTHFRLPISF